MCPNPNTHVSHVTQSRDGAGTDAPPSGGIKDSDARENVSLSSRPGKVQDGFYIVQHDGGGNG